MIRYWLRSKEIENITSYVSKDEILKENCRKNSLRGVYKLSNIRILKLLRATLLAQILEGKQ